MADQLLAGELPFQGDNLSSLLYQITQVKHPTLRSFNPRIPVACEQIIAHPDAELGQAGVADDALDPTVRSGYVEIAERRRTIPQAVVLGMLDPQLAVSRVQTQDGVRFVLSAELDELQKQSAVRSVEQVIPAGQLGNFTGTELRLKYGLASHLVRDRLQLASALQLPAGGVLAAFCSSSKVWSIWPIKLGLQDHSSATAPAECGEAIEVPV